jgi:hypothetical protein
MMLQWARSSIPVFVWGYASLGGPTTIVFEGHGMHRYNRVKICSLPITLREMNKQLLSNNKIPIDNRRRLYQAIVVNIVPTYSGEAKAGH